MDCFGPVVCVTVYVPNYCSPPGTCPVTISYRTRHACGTFWDVKICGMGVDGLNTCFCNVTTTTDVENIFKSALKIFLTTNPMGFACPPCSTQTTASWRFWSTHCSKSVIIADPITQVQRGWWQPCDNGESGMCYQTWDQCCNDDGSISRTNMQTGVWSGQAECHDPCSIHCFLLDF